MDERLLKYMRIVCSQFEELVVLHGILFNVLDYLRGIFIDKPLGFCLLLNYINICYFCREQIFLAVIFSFCND